MKGSKMIVVTEKDAVRLVNLKTYLKISALCFTDGNTISFEEDASFNKGYKIL